MKKKKTEHKYRITLTEHQLRLIANCVEDCCRFAAGQMELNNTSHLSTHYLDLTENLSKLQHLMTPELPRGASYDWAGNHCHNEEQRKFIAESYCIYREIRHRLTVDNNIQNVYSSPTLTCSEGGELPKIERL